MTTLTSTNCVCSNGLLCLKNDIFLIFENSNIHKRSKRVSKIHFLCCTRHRSAQTPYFGQKTSIFKSSSSQIFAVKVLEPVKTILYIVLQQKEVKFKSDSAYFEKLCLPKWVILFKKQHFGSFENSNIRNKKKSGNKNHFLSWTKHIFENLSKI